jgi:hypothetical protein
MVDGSDSACCVARCIGASNMIPGAAHQRIMNELVPVSQQTRRRALDFKASAACGCLERCLSCLVPVTACDGRKSLGRGQIPWRSTPPWPAVTSNLATTKPLPAPLHANPNRPLPHSLLKVRLRPPLLTQHTHGLN